MSPSDAPGTPEEPSEGGWPQEFALEAQRLAQRLDEAYPFPPDKGTWCGFGTPPEPRATVVLYCNAPAGSRFNQELPGTGGCCVAVWVCDDHADLLTRLHEHQRG